MQAVFSSNGEHAWFGRQKSFQIWVLPEVEAFNVKFLTAFLLEIF